MQTHSYIHHRLFSHRGDRIIKIGVIHIPKMIMIRVQKLHITLKVATFTFTIVV